MNHIEQLLFVPSLLIAIDVWILFHVSGSITIMILDEIITTFNVAVGVQ